MNASGRRAARAWVARQPVQCAGTSTSGARSLRAWQVASMRGSNSGPGEVEAAEHGVYAVDPGKPTSVPDDVDHDAI